MSKKEEYIYPGKSKTGIKGLSAIQDPPMDGFKVFFSKKETGTGKNSQQYFSYGFYKGIRPAFERAVKARYDFEMEKFGKTIIRLDKMDEYFKLTQKNYGDKLKWL